MLFPVYFAERYIRSLFNIFYIFIIYFGSIYDYSYPVSTGYAPFFLNGGHIPSMIRDLGNLGVGVPGVTEFVKKALLHLMDAHDALIEARGFQTVYANRHQMKEPLIKEGDLVYLSTKNLCITLG